MHLTNAEFLKQLQQLFTSRQSHGGLFLTHKRRKPSLSSPCLPDLPLKRSPRSSRADENDEPTVTFESPPAAAGTAVGGGDVEMQEASGSGAGEGVALRGKDGGGAGEEEGREYPCLVRATDGKRKDAKGGKIKLSTIVQPSDYATFTTSYSLLLKSNLTTLRKKKKTKPLPKPLGATAPTGATSAGGNNGNLFPMSLTKVIGPRRGTGHAKRQSLKKRREKEVPKLLARRNKERGSGTKE